MFLLFPVEHACEKRSTELSLKGNLVMQPEIKEVVYVKDVPKQGIFFFAGDIGGTNSNFGVFEITKKPILLFSLHAKSKDITSYPDFIAYLREYIQHKYSIEVFVGCIGAAGIISENRMTTHPTNLNISLNAHDIQQKSGMQHLLLINDFEAVGLGIELLPESSLIRINEGAVRAKAHRATIGAGTGMGKAALLWHRIHNRYIPFSSEGGHADAVGQSAEDLALFDFIRMQADHCGGPVSWEDVLSGIGIQRIYNFLGNVKEYPKTQFTQELETIRFPPDLISKYAKLDERCKDTFLVYSVLYARCAKSFVLDMLALGGMYIAGGIAAKNIEIFKNPVFMREFLLCGKHEIILKDVPVIVIADYNVSLYGAVNFMQLYNQGMV